MADAPSLDDVPEIERLTLWTVNLTWLRYRRSFAVVTETIEDPQPTFFVHAKDETTARALVLSMTGWHQRTNNDYRLTVRPAVLSDLSYNTDQVAMRGLLRLEV